MHPMGAFESFDLWICVPIFVIQFLVFLWNIKIPGKSMFKTPLPVFRVSLAAIFITDLVPYVFYGGFFGIDNYYLEWSTLYWIAFVSPILLTPLGVYLACKAGRSEYKARRFLVSVATGVFFGVLLLFNMYIFYS